MNKIISLILLIIVTLSFTSCSNKTDIMEVPVSTKTNEELSSSTSTDEDIFLIATTSENDEDIIAIGEAVDETAIPIDENPKECDESKEALADTTLVITEKENDFPFEIPKETEIQKENYSRLMKAWDKLSFPKNMKATLTWDQARALVNQSNQDIQSYVKTLPDYVLFMAASNWTQYSGDLSYEDNQGIIWHFNYSVDTLMKKHQGNCGGNSSVVAYLLKDDYEDVGMVCWRNEKGKGGHVMSYIYDGNGYYFFDMNQFIGNYENGICLMMGKDLNSLVTNKASKEKLPVKMAYTYSGCYDGDAPTGWSSDNTTYMINGYGNKINIVFETPDEGYVYSNIDVEQSVLDSIKALR